jgi:DNA-binding transcriptional LysR family regulator
VLGRFHVTHPLVTFQLRTVQRGGSAARLADVAAGTLDLAMVASMDHISGVRLQQLGAVRWRFVCPRRHPLAEAGSVTLEDLKDETFRRGHRKSR